MSTPITDANLWAAIAGCIKGGNGEPIRKCYVPATVAQQLELQLAAANADILRLERDLKDFMGLYSDWKAYATNLESSGDQMLASGYHSQRVVIDWAKAKDTRP